MLRSSVTKAIHVFTSRLINPTKLPPLVQAPDLDNMPLVVSPQHPYRSIRTSNSAFPPSVPPQHSTHTRWKHLLLNNEQWRFLLGNEMNYLYQNTFFCAFAPNQQSHSQFETQPRSVVPNTTSACALLNLSAQTCRRRKSSHNPKDTRGSHQGARGSNGRWGRPRRRRRSRTWRGQRCLRSRRRRSGRYGGDGG